MHHVPHREAAHVSVPLLHRGFDLLNWILIGIGLTYVFSAYVPYNMDEFFQYHAIACWFYPHNMLNVFREGCTTYDQNLFGLGMNVSLLANPYSGNISSLLYLPFFLLWRSPLSARLIGFLFLLVQAEVLRKILRLPRAPVMLGLLLFFPYAWMHFADTGPVSFQCTSVFLLYSLSRKWSKHPSWQTALQCGALIALGIWIKFTYFWLIPGIAAMGLLHMYHEKTFTRHFRSASAHLAIALVACCVFISPLLFSPSAENSQVYPVINELTSRGGYSLQQFIHGGWQHSGVYQALMNPMQTVQRQFVVPQGNGLTDAYPVVLYLFVPVCLLGGLVFRRLRRRFAFDAAAFYLFFWMTAVFVIRTKSAWAMHHAVLSYPFLLLSLAFAIRSIGGFRAARAMKVLRAGWLAVFVLVNIALVSAVPSLQAAPSDDPSKKEVNRILADPHLSEEYVYVVIDWGMYYYQSLYGSPHQSVIYMEPFDRQENVYRARKVAMESGRKLLFIYQSAGKSEVSLFERSYWMHPCAAVPQDSAWQIKLEDDNAEENPCFEPQKLAVN